MNQKRWLKIISGTLAIGLVILAVVWVVTPKEINPTQSSGGLNAAIAAVGINQGSKANSDVIGDNKVKVIEPVRYDKSPALRDIQVIEPTVQEEMLLRQNEGDIKFGVGSFNGTDPGLQTEVGITTMPSPIVNFDGVNNVNGVMPPDTQGAVGPNHYVQWVNLAYAIYNKSGALLYGPANGNTIWSGFGGPCQTYNSGDPITMYDQQSDRWFMSQFTTNIPGPYYQCIAVSASSDPLGAWYRYAYLWPNNNFPDYPKFGVWPDAYFLAVNQFNSSLSAWMGQGVAAFDRSQMLLGLPATMIYFDLYTVNSNYGAQLPADWDGSIQPPSGAPGIFIEWDDSAWFPPNDALRVWEFHYDWITPGNSYFGTGAPGSAGGPNYIINTNNVDPTLNGIDQPGTTQNLDDLADRLMYRLQYRNFGTYQTLVSNHTVDTNNPAGIAGIHWFELRNNGTGWAMFQEGTYAPSDLTNRWMGSIAMDGSGNMALGFSVSSSSIYPSIRYVGRLAGDPLGTLPQSEITMMTGTGYQSSSYGRWGDYSAMQIDPVDDCTFWFTTEYIATSGSANWRTRIGSFKFDTCGGVNLPPTDISLTGSTVPENSPVNTVVGTLSTADPNPGNTFTYVLVGGDTTAFNIAGNTLQTSAVFDFETLNSYTVTIRSTDQGGLYFEKTFSISVTDVNEAPTDVSLSASVVYENEPINTAVGSLSSTDPDAGNSFTYSIVGGDMTAFNIAGDLLRTSQKFDFESQSSYSVMIRTTDQGGLWFEETFEISILDRHELYIPIIVR